MINEWSKDVEIIEIAMATEQKAYEFYSAAAENSGDFLVKQVFSTLALEEEGHLKTLSVRFGTPLDSLPLKSIRIPKELDVHYKAFQKMLDNPDFGTKGEEILMLSLEFEEQGGRFYSSAAAIVESDESRKILKELASDEAKHYAMINEALSSFKNKNR